MFTLYVAAVEALPFRDVLGELFMELDVKSVRAGQFFTPWPVVLMMAKMQFDREAFESAVREKGHVSVCDPAVGSGVMLLAYAKVVCAELGRQGLRHLKLYGQDIDPRCVHMCRIQLRLNGLDSFGRIAALYAAGQATAPYPDPPAKPGDDTPDPIVSYNTPRPVECRQLELF